MATENEKQASAAETEKRYQAHARRASAVVEKAIERGTPLAISVDTNRFEALGFALDSPTLRALAAYVQQGVPLVFPSVWDSEVRAHLREHIKKKLDTASGGLKVTPYLGEPYLSAGRPLAKLLAEANAQTLADAAWGRYLESCKRIELSPPENSAASVLELYFSRQPPFTDQKKSEFPDAFALAALKEYAANNGSMVIVVTNDFGVLDHCALHADYFAGFPTLEDAFAALDRRADIERLTKASESLSALFAQRDGPLRKKVETELADLTYQRLHEMVIDAPGIFHPHVVTARVMAFDYLPDPTTGLLLRVHQVGPPFIFANGQARVRAYLDFVYTEPDKEMGTNVERRLSPFNSTIEVRFGLELHMPKGDEEFSALPASGSLQITAATLPWAGARLR